MAEDEFIPPEEAIMLEIHEQVSRALEESGIPFRFAMIGMATILGMAMELEEVPTFVVQVAMNHGAKMARIGSQPDQAELN